MSVRRFEHRENGHYKFWTISKVSHNKYTGAWTVGVVYGKIGTDGKPHFNHFWSEPAAQAHYARKVSEKLKKGYKEVTEKKPILLGVPELKTVSKPKVKPCEHLQLRRKNNLSWECNACKTLVEFDKPQPGVAASVIDTEEKAHRFFDLSAFGQ